VSHVLLLDSNVWSHLILGDVTMRNKVTAQLAALRLKYSGASIATSAICVAECLVAVRRLSDSVLANQFEALFWAQFNNPDVMIVAVTALVLDRAASLRANRLKLATGRGSQTAGADGGKLLLPDAIIGASCLDFNPPAILVTQNQTDFRYIEDGIQKTVADLVVEGVG
jgi:predicted nucleic acid-binding protein